MNNSPKTPEQCHIESEHSGCLETAAYLVKKCRFEQESRDGFAEAERIAEEYLARTRVPHNGD